MENKPNGESFSRSQSRGIHRRQHSQKLPVRPAGVLVLHMEFADDALVDEDGDGESEEADDGEAAAGPAEVELEVLAACVPLLDPLVLVHLHAAPHLLRSLSSIRRRRRRCHVGRDRTRPPRGGAQGLAEEPPSRVRGEAGDDGRRVGEPHDLALHHPRQAGDRLGRWVLPSYPSLQ